MSDETIIAPALDTVAQQMGSQVAIGSYPVSACLTGLYVCTMRWEGKQGRLNWLCDASLYAGQPGIIL